MKKEEREGCEREREGERRGEERERDRERTNERWEREREGGEREGEREGGRREQFIHFTTYYYPHNFNRLEYICLLCLSATCPLLFPSLSLSLSLLSLSLSLSLLSLSHLPLVFCLNIC